MVLFLHKFGLENGWWSNEDSHSTPCSIMADGADLLGFTVFYAKLQSYFNQHCYILLVSKLSVRRSPVQLPSGIFSCGVCSYCAWVFSRYSFPPRD